MDVFVFVSDEGFRKSLESDYEEMEKCLKHGANKAVLVLAGSIIETILGDYLIDIKYNNLSEKEILKMDLGRLMKECNEEGIISKKAYDLSSVVKDYRNLIHPGRLLRLKESIDEDDSSVAKALVNIIIKDISSKRMETYGPTAEQIISKLENDPFSFDIITHLIENTKEVELKRLLLKLIPEKYFELLIHSNYSLANLEIIETRFSALGKCFKASFEKVSVEIKKEVMQNFLSILKTGDIGTINTYTEKFIRCQFFEYLKPNDLEVVINHLLSKMNSRFNSFDLETLEDIGKFLKKEDVKKFITPLIYAILEDYDGLGDYDEHIKTNIEFFINDEYNKMEIQAQTELKNQLGSWIRSHLEELDEYELRRLENIKERLDDDILF